jgi:transposase-like protein
MRVTGFDDGANHNIKTSLEVTLMLQSTQKIIRHKVGLLNLAEELGNVSKACQMMGLSRDTFYRYRDAVEEGGVEALLEKTRRVPNPKNRVDLETENAVVDYAVECPAHGQVRVSNELRKRGVFVSPSGVRSIWLRHDLAHFKTRLKALEAKVAEEGIILTEAQVQALEKKKLDDEAWGEIDTAHPGYPWVQGMAYRLTREIEAAISAFEASIARHADFLAVHIALTATLGEADRQVEARKAASEILRLDPDFSIKSYLEGLSYKDPAELVRFENGLLSAGLPE